MGATMPILGESQASSEISRIITRGQYVLMVGTLEPRKGHALALMALEALWQQHVDINLLIIGRSGWHTRYLEERLKILPERY